MKGEINKEVLCYLKWNDSTKLFEVDYVKIELPFTQIIERFNALCDNPNNTLEQIIDFIKDTEEFNSLLKQIDYCEDLESAFLKLDFSKQTIIDNYSKGNQLTLHDRNELKKIVRLCSLAYGIAEINRSFFCNILYDNSFCLSHSELGFRSKFFGLTRDFGVTIDTNFGYGSSSYFYTKFRYKDFDITPYSDWIEYEFAKITQLKRYTKSYQLENESWLDALEHIRDACNLSITDEAKFIEYYIIQECEIMVTGLEHILNYSSFSFKERKGKIVYKSGHKLSEFRGEKISGALDFISKLLDLEKLASLKPFICRIEACNEKILPKLIEETKHLRTKISIMTNKKDLLEPNYQKYLDRISEYYLARNEFEAHMDIDMKTDYFVVQKAFEEKYPEWKKFIREFDIITAEFREVELNLKILINTNNNISNYIEKISQYFETKVTN